MAWLVVDTDLRVVDGNGLFWSEVAFGGRVLPGTPLDVALPAELRDGVCEAARGVLRTGEPNPVCGVKLLPPGEPHRVVDLLVMPARMHGRDMVMIASSALGDAGRRVEELTLLHDMIRVLRQQTSIDRVLFTALTCATAGSGGLGFNRAWVLLVDDTGERLEGAMALGPSSSDEAMRIWAELTGSPRTLADFADAYDRWAEEPHPLQQTVRQMRFSMQDEAGLLPVLASVEGQAAVVTDAARDPRVSPRLAQLLGTSAFTVVPMVVGSTPRGVILADNVYSGAPITQGHVRLLSLFAQHAGMAIEDAQLHRTMEDHQRRLEEALTELRKTQAELVRTGKLAALGEMSARIAHDLRNPIVTLGGWARLVQEDPSDVETVARAAGIIAEESANLEGLLSMLLEPFTARHPRLEPTDLSRLVEDTLQTHENAAREQQIEVVRDYAPALPKVPADAAQFRRCLANLMKNAVQSMPRGGRLSVRTARTRPDEVIVQVADTGIGMTEEQSARAFDAFYSTGHYGSGLGLTIVWDIVQSHGFTIEVHSRPGEGSTFTIRVPVSPT
jgi:signal transduction histidine kinase